MKMTAPKLCTTQLHIPKICWVVDAIAFCTIYLASARSSRNWGITYSTMRCGGLAKPQKLLPLTLDSLVAKDDKWSKVTSSLDWFVSSNRSIAFSILMRPGASLTLRPDGVNFTTGLKQEFQACAILVVSLRTKKAIKWAHRKDPHSGHGLRSLGFVTQPNELL